MNNNELGICDADSKVIDGIYQEVIENLKSFIGNENIKFQICLELRKIIIFQVWEVQNKVSKEYIEKIIQENMFLKNELRSMKTQLKLLKEKTDEILSNNQRTSTPDDIKINIGNKSKQVLSLEEKNSTSDKLESKYDTNITIDNVAGKNIEIINENLNKIRDVFQQCNSQGKLHQELAMHQSHIRKKYTNKILISNSNLKSIQALVEKIPRLVPDEFAKVCKSCTGIFGVCRWKYHCRVCGYLYCFHCSNNFDNFLPFYLNTVRICDDCFKEKKNQVFLL